MPFYEARKVKREFQSGILDRDILDLHFDFIKFILRNLKFILEKCRMNFGMHHVKPHFKVHFLLAIRNQGCSFQVPDFWKMPIFINSRVTFEKPV